MQAANKRPFVDLAVLEGRKIIINYLPPKLDEVELFALLSGVGKVEHVKIIKDLKTGNSLGFGFVTFHLAREAANCITFYNGLHLGGKVLKFSYSRPPGRDFKNANLYVANLPLEMTEHDIFRTFRPFGDIVQYTLLRNKKTGQSRGVAFVRFMHGDEANNALTALNGKMLKRNGHAINIKVVNKEFRSCATNHHR